METPADGRKIGRRTTLGALGAGALGALLPATVTGGEASDGKPPERAASVARIESVDTGEVIWQTDEHHHNGPGAPVIVDDVVYHLSEAGFMALDARTGEYD